MGMVRARIPKVLYDGEPWKSFAMRPWHCIPGDAEMVERLDEESLFYHFEISHPSFPDRGADAPEEVWDHGLECAHWEEFGPCDMGAKPLACRHAKQA